jgi:glutamate formiminotransferase/formiminotetrahydrofolate cyclodeaminase
MVANVSSHRAGWDERWEEFSNWAEEGKTCHDELLGLIDADTDAFTAVMSAWGLPRRTDEETAARDEAIQTATRQAIEVPLRVMEVAVASMEVIGAMAEIGLPASAPDAGVGALCARSAAMGAYLNVKANAGGLTDPGAAAEYLRRGLALQEQATAREAEILAVVERHLDIP